jgi:hypothetical protein
MDSRSFRSRLITCWRCGICLGVTAIPLIGCWGVQACQGGLGLLTGRPTLEGYGEAVRWVG